MDSLGNEFNEFNNHFNDISDTITKTNSEENEEINNVIINKIDSIDRYYKSKIDSLVATEVSKKLDSIASSQKKKKKTEEKDNRLWLIKGDNSLTFNQAAFSNWSSGGSNSFGLNTKIDYTFNYKRNSTIWNNRIIISYGQLSNQKDKPRKTDDQLSISSTFGRRINSKWYKSLTFDFNTQIAEGFNYGATPNYSSKDRISNFMAPAYASLGLGLTYTPNKNFELAIKPVTLKSTFVLDKKLQKKDNFGLENDGDFIYLELGGMINAVYKATLLKNIKTENTLNIFSNYLDHAERLAIIYKGALNMKINQYISSKLTLDIIYNHNIMRKTQIKQTMGVGFAYLIDNKINDKNK